MHPITFSPFIFLALLLMSVRIGRWLMADPQKAQVPSSHSRILVWFFRLDFLAVSVCLIAAQVGF